MEEWQAQEITLMEVLEAHRGQQGLGTQSVLEEQEVVLIPRIHCT